MDLKESIQSKIKDLKSKIGGSGGPEMTTNVETTNVEEKMPTEDEVRNALKSVYDPEIGISIQDLGLVYGVRNEGKNIVIDLTLTTPACPLGPVIKTQAHAVLTNNFPAVDDVEINLVWTPRWDPRTM